MYATTLQAGGNQRRWRRAMKHELSGDYRAALRSCATSAAVLPTAPIVIATLRSCGCSALPTGSDGSEVPACAGALAD